MGTDYADFFGRHGPGFGNHRGHRGFGGLFQPQVAGRMSRVNLSYYGHAVARNLESKSTARVFTQGAAALRAEFAVRIEDLGVLLLRWAFNVQRSAFRCGTGILPVFHGRDAPLTSHLLLPTAYCLLPTTSYLLPLTYYLFFLLLSRRSAAVWCKLFSLISEL